MYIAGKDITVGSEVTGSPVKELSSVYDATEEGLPVYEVSKSQNGYRVLKELSQKEIKKGIEKKYKRLDIAIFFKSLSEVKKIFELKTPVRRSSEYSLCYAVRSGSLPIVKAVMESGEIDLNDYYSDLQLAQTLKLNFLLQKLDNYYLHHKAQVLKLQQQYLKKLHPKIIPYQLTK